MLSVIIVANAFLFCTGARNTPVVGGQGPAGAGPNRFRQDGSILHSAHTEDSRHQGTRYFVFLAHRYLGFYYGTLLFICTI